MSKYKVGDKVVINHNCLESNWVGFVGVISETPEPNDSIYTISLLNKTVSVYGNIIRLRESRLDPYIAQDNTESVNSIDDNGGLNLL